MASPEPRPANTSNAVDHDIEDELDDLFNYEAGSADVFRAIDTNMDVSNEVGEGESNKRKRELDDLGIDEEIKVRTRVPNVKLDEERLLSEKGIPRLRKLAKKNLRLKGKGHEFSDVARLLAFYQLWLDDLYPKARFADGLAIIEKLGHSRRMQVMRREWIEGEKNYEGGDGGGGGDGGDTQTGGGDASMEEEISGEARDASQTTATMREERAKTPDGGALDEDDLYSATPRAPRPEAAPTATNDAATDQQMNDEPDEDELDVLFMGAVNRGQDTGPARAPNDNGRTNRDEEDEDEDELDALFSSTIRNGPFS